MDTQILGEDQYEMDSNTNPGASPGLPNKEPAPPDQYLCFPISIKVYQFVGFLAKTPPTSLAQKIFYILPWASWTYFSVSLLINFVLIMFRYTQDPEMDIKGNEIFQRAFEVFLTPLFIMEMRTFTVACYPLVVEMQATFHRDAKTMGRIAYQEKALVLFSYALVSGGVMAYYRKLFFGLPPEEVKLVSYYYHKSQPERQLPFLMWFPFDDTVAPMYYVVAAFNGYLLILTFILSVHINACTLIFAIHIRGQYQILAEYLRQVGNPRLFPYSGNRAPLPRSAEGHQYAVDCVKVIIKRHQYLIDFRNRLQAQLKGMLLIKLAVFNLVLTVCLYQLTFITRLDAAAFQLVIQFVCVYSFSFILTLASEIIEQGNTTLHWAAYTNPWYKYIVFKPQTKPYRTAKHGTTGKPTDQACTTSTAQHGTTGKSTDQACTTSTAQHGTTGKPTDRACTSTAQHGTTGKPTDQPCTSTAQHGTAGKPTDWACTSTAHAEIRNAPRDAHARNQQHPVKTVSHIPMLVLLTKQCQIPIRFRFYGSHIDVCYRMFIAVLRFSYSLFALMKQSIQIEK